MRNSIILILLVSQFIAVFAQEKKDSIDISLIFNKKGKVMIPSKDVNYSNEITWKDFFDVMTDTTVGRIEIVKKYSHYYDSVYFDRKCFAVSWDDAMDFCRRKTIIEQNNKTDSIFRLPKLSEFILIYNDNPELFIDAHGEWLLNAKDETPYISSPFIDYLYDSRDFDNKVKKRKMVIGGNWIGQYLDLDFYEFECYYHVSFRIVKTVENE